MPTLTCFLLRYNDYFSITIRSQDAGGLKYESNSMNALGFAAFDYSSGSTAWREVNLPLACTGDVVQVDVVVANVADYALDSFVYVDFVATTTVTDVPSCGLGEEAEVLLAIGPIDAALAFANSRDAIKAAAESGLTGATNGAFDAMRHCTWNCLMARSIGAAQAKEVGDLHEGCNTDNDCPALAMDLHNNLVGRELGQHSPAECPAACRAAINANQTQNSLPPVPTP